MPKEYTRNELRILWHLKRHGPYTNPGVIAGRGGVESSIVNQICEQLDLRKHTVQAILRHLEKQLLVLRSYKRPKTESFGGGPGFNPMVRLELIDPDMWLPELPPPLPLGVVLANENEEMYQATSRAPTEERVIEMLLKRIEELQEVADKLHTIVTEQAAENETLKHQVERLTRPARKHLSEHLSSRVQDSLTPEQWDALSHGNGDD